MRKVRSDCRVGTLEKSLVFPLGLSETKTDGIPGAIRRSEPSVKKQRNNHPIMRFTQLKFF